MYPYVTRIDRLRVCRAKALEPVIPLNRTYLSLARLSVSPKQERPVRVGDLPEPSVVPVAGVGRSAAHHHGRLEETSQAGEVLVVYQPGVGVNADWVIEFGQRSHEPSVAPAHAAKNKCDKVGVPRFGN